MSTEQAGEIKPIKPKAGADYSLTDFVSKERDVLQQHQQRGKGERQGIRSQKLRGNFPQLTQWVSEGRGRCEMRESFFHFDLASGEFRILLPPFPHPRELTTSRLAVCTLMSSKRIMTRPRWSLYLRGAGCSFNLLVLILQSTNKFRVAVSVCEQSSGTFIINKRLAEITFHRNLEENGNQI